MAKWFGKIGFEGQTMETAPSVCTEETVEREYYGDVLEWGRQLQAGDGVNDNVTFQNRLSIVADPFAHENFGSIRCTKLKLPLDSPDNKQFTFGLTSKKLSKRVDTITSAINNVKNALFGLIGHVNEDDSSS